jgi:polyferredoxin
MLRKGRNPQDNPRGMARALALRVALSIGLFLFILLAWSWAGSAQRAFRVSA